MRRRPAPSDPVLTPGARLTTLLGYGLASVPVVGAVVPFAVQTGTGSGVVVALLMSMGLLGLWACRLLLEGRLVILRTALNAPVLVMSVIWVLALLSSNVFLDARVAESLGPGFVVVQIAAVIVTVVSLGLLLLGANIPPRRTFIRLAVGSIIGVGAIHTTVVYAGYEHELGFLKTSGLFTMWVITLAYGQALFNHRLAPLVRAGLLLLVGAMMYHAAVRQTIWLSGWAPALTALGLITLLRSRRLTAGGVVAGLVVVAANWSTVYEEVVQSQVDEGSDSRLDIWLQAWDLLSQHPLLGTGPAGYAAYYMTLYVGSGSSMSTHSNYIDIAAQTGIVGTLAAGWLAAATLWIVWKGCRRWRDGLYGGFASSAFGGLVGAGLAMALGDWVIPFVYNQGIEGFRYTVHTWVYLGLAAGLAVAPEGTVDA